MHDLMTKADIMRIKGWSYEFFNALNVPAHHIGKRNYFMLEDVEAAINTPEPEPVLHILHFLEAEDVARLKKIRERINAALSKHRPQIVSQKVIEYKAVNRHSSKFRTKYPIKYEAHKIVKHSIASGKLTKQPCEECGTIERVDAHHDDYSKPLAVRWLCRAHHHLWHQHNVAVYDKAWEN